MEHLKRRQDFVAAARAPSAATPGLVLQALNRQDSALPRLGFTCSKKIGNAVTRNRAKRRLREAFRRNRARFTIDADDIVLVARRSAVTAPWQALIQDLLQLAAQAGLLPPAP